MASSKNKPSPREEQLQRVAARLKLSRFMDSNKPVTWSDEVVAGHSKAVKELRDAIPEDSSILNEFTPEAVQKIRQEKQAIPVSLKTVGVKPVENPERLVSSEITSSNPGIDPSKYLETNEDAIRSRFVLSTDARGFTTASYQDPNPISTAQVSIGPRIEYKEDGVPVYLGHKGTFSVKTNNSSRTDMNQSLNGCGPNCDQTYEYRVANSTDWGPSLVAHQDQEAHLSRVIDDAVKHIALYHRGLLGEKNTYGFDSGEYYRGRAKKAQEQQASSGATAEFTTFQDKYEKTVAGIDSSGKPNGIEDEDWKSLDANQKAIVAKFAQHHDDYVGSTVDDAGLVHLTHAQYELSNKMGERLHKLEHSFGWQDSGYEWHHDDLEPNDHDTNPYHRVVLKQNLPIINRMSTLLKNYKFADLLSKDNYNPSLESSQLREGTPLSLPSSSEQPQSALTVQEQNQAETEAGTNVSAQMTEAGVAPALPSQPTATYQSGGSLSWKDSLDKFNEWRAAKKVTYKDNGPAIRKIAKEIRAKSPGVVGHLLDLDDKFSSLTNNQRLSEDDPRKELVNSLRSAAQSIHSHISDKASNSPDELATELPQSLRADHLLNETPTIAKEADVGQPDKIDPNLWVTLSPDQKNHVKNYVRLHDKVQSFQLPNGQIAGSDESLSAYNEMHNYRRKLETSFGATGASKVGNEKYDVASKKVFDLLKEYPLGIARVF
jgi:hypothetical protein